MHTIGGEKNVFVAQSNFLVALCVCLCVLCTDTHAISLTNPHLRIVYCFIQETFEKETEKKNPFFYQRFDASEESKKKPTQNNTE